MKAIWAVFGLTAMAAATPAMASETDKCAIQRPADSDLKTYAGQYYPKADAATIGALLA